MARPIPSRRRSTPQLLTVENVLQYCVAKGLVRRTDAVDRPLFVWNYTRRNRNFKVVVPDAESLLVKQAMDPSRPHYRKTLEVEANLLKAVAQRPSARPMRWFAPRFLRFNRRDAVMVTQLVHPATTLARYHLNVGRFQFPQKAAITAARILADFHRLGTNALSRGGLGAVPSVRPFIWECLPPLEAAKRLGNDPAARLHGLLRAHAPYWDNLPRLRAYWDSQADLVHCDPRWDNFLLTHGVGPHGFLNLRLIDWELAGRGDSAWDVGYFLTEYLRFWLLNAPPQLPVGNLGSLERSARFGPVLWRDSARTFWLEYARRRRLRSAERAVFLQRVASYLPFNLIVVAYENLELATRYPELISIAGELALQFHHDPPSAFENWFGFRPRGAQH